MSYLDLHYLPLALPFFIVLILFSVGVFGLVRSRGPGFASRTIGIPLKHLFLLLLASLAGSYINIPVYTLPAERLLSGQVVSYFGMQYVIPTVTHWPGTVIAINVGGAVVPLLVSLYLVARYRILGPALLAIAVVALVCHAVAQPVRGLGIAEPVFVPAVATAFTAIAISRKYAASLAYIAGSTGTLIGADLLNLEQVRGLGAPVASIGGAGTFDGIFLTSVLAVGLAVVLRDRTA